MDWHWNMHEENKEKLKKYAKQCKNYISEEDKKT